MALKPLHDHGRIKRVLVSTYQAVSGAGASGVRELDDQNRAIAYGQPIPAPSTFTTQIAANVIPHIGGFDGLGYTSEEMKLVHETRKILGDSSILITPMMTARVPVAIGHSEAVYVETERPISPDTARALWAEFPGVEVIDDIQSKDAASAYPTPLASAKSDSTYIGRIRQDIGNPHGLVFWVVADNLRKGAASNAVQIAEKLIELGLLGK
jgi:aspartate-semialdehyde dehydrogenase